MEQQRDDDRRTRRCGMTGAVDAAAPTRARSTNTSTPATAESPASISIAAVTSARVVHTRTPHRDDARGRRPHTAGNVLREHRDDLGVERGRVRDPDVPLEEDPHPAEDEDEVVRGHRKAREHEVRGIRVAQILAGRVERPAHAPDQQPEEDREEERARPRLEVARALLRRDVIRATRTSTCTRGSRSCSA